VPSGEIAYLTLEMPDLRAANDFYTTVFGWQFTPGHVANGRQVRGPVPMTGVAGDADVPGAVALFAVDDVAAAVARVRAAGGTATEPERQPYGVTSSCTDDQGMRFYLGELD
jgi:predicted enzyme related to lactoylglutathione lyase